MTKGFAITGITPFCATAYASSCGNGVVESGEDCDDTSACCVSCKLKTGAVCTPGTNGINTCQIAQHKRTSKRLWHGDGIATATAAHSSPFLCPFLFLLFPPH